MKRISIKLKLTPYQVLIGHGLLRDAGKHVKRLLPSPGSLCLVVTSPKVRKLWGKALAGSLRSASVKFHVVEVRDGEPAKNLDTVEQIMAAFMKAKADRSSVVIAFGGGVIGDMAGFAASVFMRGIPVIQVPTTLLSQVDASIGGKTGVNLLAGKNLLGTFHQPRLVLTDPQVLSTLPDREFRAGLFEIIKCGAIGSRSLFDGLRKQKHKILGLDKKTLAAVIAESVAIKAMIVAADERENDQRRILNFGHTVGHALEAATGYKRFLHGEAVGWGMVAAASIGMAEGVTPVPVAQKVLSAVMDYGPLPSVNLSDAALLSLLSSDKKAKLGISRFVLLQDIGRPVVVKGVSSESVLYGLHVLRNVSQSQGQSRG